MSHNPSDPSSSHSIASRTTLSTTPGATANAAPELVWSSSRQTNYEGCARAHYWSYEVAPTGRQKNAPPEARLARALKMLTSLDFERGRVLHTRAAEYVTALRDGRDLPGVVTMYQRSASRLNAVWAARRNIDEWRRDPAKVPMLIEAYYGREPSPERLARIKEQLQAATRTLRGLAMWQPLASCDPKAIIVIDSIKSYVLPDRSMLDGSEPAHGELPRAVTVWGASDLIARPVEERPVEITDYKSGTSDSPRGVADAIAQVVTYGVLLRYGLRILQRDEECRGRIVWLGDGVEMEWEIYPEDIDSAETRIREGAYALWLAREIATKAATDAALVALESGASGEETRVAAERARRESYPMTTDRARCGRCPFLELCLPDMTSDATGDQYALPGVTMPVIEAA